MRGEDGFSPCLRVGMGIVVSSTSEMLAKRKLEISFLDECINFLPCWIGIQSWFECWHVTQRLEQVTEKSSPVQICLKQYGQET